MLNNSVLKSLGYTLWVLAVASILALLYYQDRFFAVLDIPVAKVNEVRGDISTRPESDVRWRQGQRNQSLYDGDLVATGSNSSSEIDFENTRLLKMGEETQIQILKLMIGNQATYMVTLLRGNISLNNCIGCPELIVKSGDEQFRLSEGKEFGFVKEVGKKIKKIKPAKIVNRAPKPTSEVNSILNLPDDLLDEKPKVVKPKTPKVSESKGMEPVVASVNSRGQRIPTQYWTMRPLSSLLNFSLKVPVVVTKNRPNVGNLDSFLLFEGKKGGQIYNVGLNSTDVTIPISNILRNAQVNRLASGVLEYKFSLRGGAKVSYRKKMSRSIASTSVDFSIKSFGKYTGGPVTLGFDSWNRKKDNPVWMTSKNLISPNSAPIAIHLENAEYMPSFEPYIVGAKSVGRSRKGIFSNTGIFVVKAQKVVAQLRGGLMNNAVREDILKILRADFIYEGSRYALSGQGVAPSEAQIKNLLNQGKTLYVLKRKKLYPVSKEFVNSNAEVANFVNEQAKLIFFEKVIILNYR